MTVEYRDSLDGIKAEQLAGFFEGWPNPPTPDTHLSILRGSSAIVLAYDPESQEVVGFVNALSDGVLSAYIPLLEVKPAFRGRGIGAELVRRILDALGELYMVDVLCDPETQAFYMRLGFTPASGVSIRRYHRQAGTAEQAYHRST